MTQLSAERAVMEELSGWAPQHNLYPALSGFRNDSKIPARPRLSKQWKQLPDSGPGAILRIWELVEMSETWR